MKYYLFIDKSELNDPDGYPVVITDEHGRVMRRLGAGETVLPGRVAVVFDSGNGVPIVDSEAQVWLELEALPQ